MAIVLFKFFIIFLFNDNFNNFDNFIYSPKAKHVVLVVFFIIFYKFSPFVDEGSHIGRPLGGEVHLFARRRMNEAQSASMEHLTGTEFEAVLDISLVTGSPLTSENLSSAIALVAEQRMADMLHVGPDLMGTPRLKDTFYQCDKAISFEHLIMGDGWLAYLRVGREHLHPQTVFRITSDITLYTPLILYEVTPHQSIIATMSGLVEELFTQRSLGIWRLGHDEQSAGVFIDAMDQPYRGSSTHHCAG